ncbi:unnamed protein product, partial [Choristocarpus tenellus]
APKAAPPQNRPQATPPAPQQSSGGGGMLSGMASTMAQGFAFGTGSAVAHRAVGAVAGSFGSGSEAPAQQEQQVEQHQAPSTGPCDLDKQTFTYCMQQNNSDVTACQFAFEALQTCQV